MEINTQDITVMILAAGKGTRMKSNTAKVLHQLFFAPMLHHVLDAVTPLNSKEIIVITGHQGDDVKKSICQYNVRFATQKEQLGTGHAVLTAKDVIQNKTGTSLILCGDTPLIQTQTLADMISYHLAFKQKATVMTTVVDNPTNYGRIITNNVGNVSAIVEEKDATADQRLIQEINAGVYCIDTSFLFDVLGTVDSCNNQGEFYLTDIVALANRRGEDVAKFQCEDASEVLGVNSRVELGQASKILQQRRNKNLMLSGVTLMDPDTTFIDRRAFVGMDVFIYPNVIVSGKSNIGEECTIHSFTNINNYLVAKGTVVDPFSNLTD